jgi:hypothetical protein
MGSLFTQSYVTALIAVFLFYLITWQHVSAQSAQWTNIKDSYDFTKPIPVQIELPGRPSSNILQTGAPSWKLSIVPKGGVFTVAKLDSLRQHEAGGKWYVLCAVPPGGLPAGEILSAAFSDATELFEPCTSQNEFCTNEECLLDLKLHTVIRFSLQYSRYTQFTIKNKGLLADFTVDGKLTQRQSSYKVKADAAYTGSFYRLTISADGYSPFSVDVQKDQIGSPTEIPVELHKKEDMLDFEKAAYFFSAGDVKNAGALIEKLRQRYYGRWGFLEVYWALFLQSEGKTSEALSIVNSMIDRGKMDSDFLLQALAGLIKTNILFTRNQNNEAHKAADAAKEAFLQERELYGESRMFPPFCSPHVKNQFDFFRIAAESESYLAFGAGTKQELLDKWYDFRNKTAQILADAQGKELNLVSPFEDRINYYVTAIGKR